MRFKQLCIEEFKKKANALGLPVEEHRAEHDLDLGVAIEVVWRLALNVAHFHGKQLLEPGTWNIFKERWKAYVPQVVGNAQGLNLQKYIVAVLVGLVVRTDCLNVRNQLPVGMSGLAALTLIQNRAFAAQRKAKAWSREVHTQLHSLMLRCLADKLLQLLLGLNFTLLGLFYFCSKLSVLELALLDMRHVR